MRKQLVIIATLLGSTFIIGCQAIPYQPYARQVKVKPKKGGVVALKLVHRDEDRAMADSLMQKACANRVVNILEEGEVATGTITNASQSNNRETSGVKVGSLWGIPITSGGNNGSGTTTASETTQKKEWQIKYNCGKAIAKSKSNRVVR